jgi:hypothetical protein
MSTFFFLFFLTCFVALTKKSDTFLEVECLEQTDGLRCTSGHHVTLQYDLMTQRATGNRKKRNNTNSSAIFDWQPKLFIASVETT